MTATAINKIEKACVLHGIGFTRAFGLLPPIVELFSKDKSRGGDVWETNTCLVSI